MFKSKKLAFPDTYDYPSKKICLILGFLNAGSVVFMNFTLSYNTISVYQLLKMACIPMIAVLQFIMYKKSLENNVKIALFIILAGVSLATVHDLSANIVGLTFGIIAVLLTGLSQMLIHNHESTKNLSGLQVIMLLSPYATGLCFLFSFIIEIQDILITNLDMLPINSIIGSCILALIINFFGFNLLLKTGAITYQVVGHLKTMLIMTFGAILFSETKSMSTSTYVGITIAFIGMFYYSYIKLNLQKTDHIPIPINEMNEEPSIKSDLENGKSEKLTD
jgi:solute carrier family 35 protein E3